MSKFVSAAIAATGFVALFAAAPAVAQLVVPAQKQAQQQNYNSGVFGSITIGPGFNPDPLNIGVQAGGPIDVSNIDSRCDGYMTDQPSYMVNFTAQGSLPLIFSVNSSDDTTILVRAPDGQTYCDDDSGQNGDNPSIAFQSPGPGQYEIWVGRFWNSNLSAATLGISEVSSY